MWREEQSAFWHLEHLASLEGLTSTSPSSDVLRPIALQSGCGSGQKHTCIKPLQDSLLHTHCTPDGYVLFTFEIRNMHRLCGAHNLVSRLIDFLHLNRSLFADTTWHHFESAHSEVTQS
jgi:hypothetical protein